MELVLLGKKPVEEKKPAGVDVKNDSDFETLQAEVQKAVSVVNKSGDWGKIVTLASSILDQKSKNLVVASYLGVGLVHSQKASGLVIGSNVYLDMIENYWDDLYPIKSRPRGRSRAIAWWAEKITSALKSLKPSLKQEEADGLCERLDKVQRFLRLNLDECPSFRPIIETIRTLVPSSSAEPIPDTTISDTTPSPTPTVSSGPKPIEQKEILTDSDVQQSLKSLKDLAVKTASYLFSRDKANPQSYRLKRWALWMGVDALPPATDGRTRIKPPEKSFMDRFELVQDKKDPALLVEFAEGQINQSLFWFDLHRISYEALISMGEKYTTAANALKQETFGLVCRIPGIEKLSFEDDQPFADAETIKWLGQTEQSEEPTETVSTEALTETSFSLEDLKPLIKKKKIEEAVKKFQAQLRAVTSGHDRFLCKLAFAECLFKSKYKDLLATQLDQIMEDLDRFRLDEFDPSLALKGLTVVLNGYRLHSLEDSKPKIKKILQRMAKIDMNEFVRKS